METDGVRLLLEQSIQIEAPAARVWALVSDVCRIPEWSPDVSSTRLRKGFEEMGLGAQFTNRNVLGELEWTTHGEIVRFDQAEAIAFRIEENWAVWSFQLTPEGEGTLLTQRREIPDGVSDLSREYTDRFLGGQDAYGEVLDRGMRQTLERIKTAAEF